MGRYCQLLDPTYFLSLSCALKRDIARQGGVPVWRRACLTSLREGGREWQVCCWGDWMLTLFEWTDELGSLQLVVSWIIGSS